MRSPRFDVRSTLDEHGYDLLGCGASIAEPLMNSRPGNQESPVQTLWVLKMRVLQFCACSFGKFTQTLLAAGASKPKGNQYPLNGQILGKTGLAQL